MNQEIIPCCTQQVPQNWKLWSRDTQKVYALSDGIKCESQIAFLVKRNVRVILHVLYASGYVTLQRGGQDILDFSLIEQSYHVLLFQQKTFLLDFRLAIFERQDVYILFSSPHFESSFLKTLYTILLKMQKHDVTTFQYIQKLGSKHEQYGVLPEHYVFVGRCFLHTLQRYIGAAWSYAMQQTWETLFSIITDVMLFGYGQFTT